MEPFRPGRGQRASRCRHPRRGLLPALEESAVREGALIEPESAREPGQIVGIEIELLRGVPDLVLCRPEIEMEVQLLRQLDEPRDLARRVPAASEEAIEELFEEIVELGEDRRLIDPRAKTPRELQGGDQIGM